MISGIQVLQINLRLASQRLCISKILKMNMRISVGTTIILALTSGNDSATRQITERNRIIHIRVERVVFSTVVSDILLYA
jgi:hypothetical protein